MQAVLNWRRLLFYWGTMTENVTLSIPAGFRFGTAEAGIKYPNRKDVGMIFSDEPASCAAVFTKNLFAAAPVHYSRDVLQNAAGYISGVIVNSGCANAATGELGMHNTAAMSEASSHAVSCNAPFLVCSTGTIGVQLPMDRIKSGIASAAASLSSSTGAFIDFADSILTTDTVRKVASETFEIDGKSVTVTGCAKGSGMIHPDMATLLAYVVTDASIDPQFLQTVFTRINNLTLNCITVDGDTSTNDTAIILASGGSGVEVCPDSPAQHPFETALLNVMTSLSRKLARDGEGATHLVEITVAGADTFLNARKAAMAVANSPLVKTAIYGKDANWGRIACALGYSGVAFDPAKTDISLGAISLMANGTPIAFDEAEALKVLGEEEIKIRADLKAGSESATVWTCDFTEKYIEINGAYRT